MEQALVNRTEIEALSVNTIRTLAIDAIQKANSGHPGTPMALAPAAYTLWQRFLRFDPEDPIWPNRDRFVLSAGHASMLLYSLLHLAGVKAVDPDYEVLGRVGDPRRHQGLQAARLEGRRPPRVPLDLRGRVDDRSARAGSGDVGRDGDRRQVAGRVLQQARIRALRLRRLCVLQRRRPDGGRLARGCVNRRASAARQPLLALRQQPHLDRRPHRDRLLRRRRRAVHGLRLARPPRRGRERSRSPRSRVHARSARTTTARR